VIPLKGYIRDEDYNGFVRLAKLNDYDSPDLYDPRDEEKKIEVLKIIKMAKDEVENQLGDKEKYMTEICWNIN
jgi:hypothetical protein